ncbi:putative polysaccharide biosynthesis protein [Ructibacterium gallinarum]|uniref:Polysaccharide biosynthesis protein n=1 Tax=Ructibacterium gallinarum TaxID=2779355 RepID=A0A9D5R853_9FIRM|nr:polysaccharide biosynthesis protein [Ructibacterium gallinarum]MBE5039610.1 polysaccharide biosynthesis protein [Ructibacterium gallinarum]
MEKNRQTTKQQTFIQGALILGVANLIVKIIGAVFKIPLINLIGDDGMGYFNIAYQIYTFMFIIATAGFPIAISKMVAESMARDDERNAHRIFQTAFIFLAVIGFLGSAVLYFFPKQLEALVAVPGSSKGILAISPAVFFVAMTSVYRGYFQGRQNMFPTAASEVIEATAKLLVGIGLAFFFMNMTVNGSLETAIDWTTRQVQSTYDRTVFASAGAIFGVTTGTFLSFALLSCIFLALRKRKKSQSLSLLRSRKSILKELILIAIPITIGASVSSLTTLIDMGTITRRLVTRPEVLAHYDFMFKEGTSFYQKVIEEGWTGLELYKQQAASLYGMYTGKALTMFNLPLTLVVALGMSVVPAISAALTRRNETESKAITESTIRIAMLFAAPCAFGMSVLSKEVLFLLFQDCNAKSVLAILSIAIIPVAVVSVTNAILQAYGKVYCPVINMVIGGAVKVLFNFIFIPYLGIDGAPAGTFLCYLIIAVLNMRYIIKYAKIRFRWNAFIFKPVAAAVIMGAVGFVLSTFLTGESFLLSASVNIWSRRILIAAEIVICALVYFLAVFTVRAIQREDILRLPKGEKLASVLTKLKLLK